MRPRPTLFLIGICIISMMSAKAQDCVRTGLNGVVVNSACNQVCRDLIFQIPDIKSTSSYTFVSTPYNPFPYVTAGGTTDTRLYADDNYSNVFPLPFPFCFYDRAYTQVVVSSNGLITLDPVYAGCPNGTAGFAITNPIPYNGGGPNCSFNHYPRLSIMGNFTDLDARATQSPPDRKIEWRSEGTAPCRRFVASFYHVGKFGNTACGLATPYTFQLILYESTGMIDIMVENSTCTSAPGNKAIMGIQDSLRTQGLAAPGKNAQNWGASNEGFRFVPSGGSSRFADCELLTMSMVPVATGVVSTSTTPGMLDITFPNICSPAQSTQYIIKTTYSACENPASSVIGYDTVTIIRAAMQANVTASATSCPGASDGTIDVTPLNANAPYTYTLDGGLPIVANTPWTFTNVSAGPHTVVVTDATGCQSAPLPVNVSTGPQLITTATKIDATCASANNGSIIVTVPTTGLAPFQYSLDNTNWQPGNIFNNLAPGNYTVYYRSANGCQGVPIPITITGPASTLVSNIVTTPVKCKGEISGTITLGATGGTAPYQYSSDGGFSWFTQTFFTVAANTYTILIRDANGCLVSQTFTVTEPAAVLTASSSTTNATCSGGNNGVITVNASGGNAGYTYSIDGVNFQASNTFNVVPNTYTITIKDVKGCTTTNTVTVGLTNDLSFTPQTDATICEGTSTQLQLVSNATQYSWTPATGLSSVTIADPVANPVITTNYTVTATLGPCTVTDDVIVNVNPAPVPNAGVDGSICFGQTYQLQGSGGTQYTWTPATYLSNANIPNPVSSPLKTITYTLSQVMDALGCQSLTTDDVVINVTPPVKVNTFPFDTVAHAGDQFQLNAIATANSYTWSPAVGLSNANIANPIVTVGQIGSDVVYKVTAFTSAGCTGEGYIRIKVYAGPDIYMPTAFTPNNDGKNDKFTPFPVGIVSIRYFRVFNRWGQLVFSSNKLHEGWDGKFSVIEAPTGVYVWMVEGTTKDNKTITKKGTVTLIR